MRRCEHPALVELTLPGAGPSGSAPSEAFVCFPPTAASASYYRFLAQALADLGSAARVFAVQYPGRETRFGEAPFTDRAEAVNEAVGAMRAEGLLPSSSRRRSRRWAWGRKRGVPAAANCGSGAGCGAEPGGNPRITLLGHSLGAQLAFDAALLVGGSHVASVVLSARVPDSSGEGHPDPVASTDADLLGWLEGLGGTPPEVLQDPELASMIADRVRGDLLLSRGPSLQGTLAVPLLLLCGERDPVASLDGMTGWGKRSSGPVEAQQLTGDHEAIRMAVGEWISKLG